MTYRITWERNDSLESDSSHIFITLSKTPSINEYSSYYVASSSLFSPENDLFNSLIVLKSPKN